MTSMSDVPYTTWNIVPVGSWHNNKVSLSKKGGDVSYQFDNCSMKFFQISQYSIR